MNNTDHERVSLSSKGFYGLGDGSNPYAKYPSSDDGDSLDDGINMDDRLENGEVQEPDQMPPEDFVLREFYDYMEVMSPMSEPETIALKRTSLVEKWSLVYNQQCRSPIFPLRHYISSLRRHNDSRRRTFSWSRGSTDKDGVSKLAHLLRKLKADMKLSQLSFIEEFADKSNDGVKMLLKVLAEIQSDKNSASTSRKQKNDEYKRAVVEEYDCLLCLKFAQRIQVGVFRFLQLDGAVDAIVSVIYGENIKSLAVALDILNNISEVAGGASVVLGALADYSIKHGEILRLKPLMAKLKIESSDQEIYSLSLLRLVNNLRSQEADAEGVVAMQHELRQAGFELSDMHKMAQYGSVFGRDIQKEIEAWDKGSIRVNEYAEEIANLQKRNRVLRDEIDHLQTEIKEAGNVLDAVKQEKTNLQRKSENYHSRASALIETLEKIESNNPDSPSQNLKEDVSSALKPLDPAATDRFATFRRSMMKSASSSPDDALSLSSFDSSASIPDAPPPPAPVPPKLLANNKNNNLPVLHWTPLYNVMGTVFQNVDNKLLREADFSEFEEKFKVSDRVQEKVVRKLSDDNTRISFVDTNRAKNLLITLRKIGKGPDEIFQAIDTCDSKVLSGEDVELLSKFIPTKEETNQMFQHKDDLGHMGEAEQFMFQMAKIERLDSKMGVLVSMGSLNQQLQLLKPKMDHINESVMSVKQNKKLHKILEIVLIFGNYMNSGKKGYAMGFKLESLSKLNSIKGKENLSFMHFLVDFLQRKFPDVVDFYKELNINSESFQGILTEVQDLRKNLDMIRYEKSLQTSNEELQKFAVIATKEMAEVGEHFRQMEAGYKEVCQMFGENYKDTEGNDVLVHINDFAENFKKYLHDVNLEDGQKTPIDRTAPSTPLTSRSPAVAIAAMLQQSEKFNQRAEIARRQSEENLDELAKRSELQDQKDPKETLRRKSRAPQPPPISFPRNDLPSNAKSSPSSVQPSKLDSSKSGDTAFAGSINGPSNQNSPVFRLKPEASTTSQRKLFPTRSSAPVNISESPPASPNLSAMQRAKSLFSSMDTPPTERTSPVNAMSSPTSINAVTNPTTQARNNSPLNVQSKTSALGPDKTSPPKESLNPQVKPLSTTQISSTGGKPAPPVSPKPSLHSTSSTFGSSQDNHNANATAQQKVSPIVRTTSPAFNQNSPTGGRMVFPAKVHSQPRNSTVYKSPVENRTSPKSSGLNTPSMPSPKDNRAPELPVKVTPTLGKKLPSPNLSNVLPNKTSPANWNRKLQRSDAVTTPTGSNASSPVSSSGQVTTSQHSETVSPSGNVKGLVKSFSQEDRQSTPEKTGPTVQKRTAPPAPSLTSPSSPVQKSPVNTSGKVIRNNSILFSAKNPGTAASKQSTSPNASSPVTSPNKPKPSIPTSTSTPSSASSSRRTSIDENHNQDAKSVKDLRRDFEHRRASSTNSDIAKAMNEFDNILQDAGVAEETVDSYL